MAARSVSGDRSGQGQSAVGARADVRPAGRHRAAAHADEPRLLQRHFVAPRELIRTFNPSRSRTTGCPMSRSFLASLFLCLLACAPRPPRLRRLEAQSSSEFTVGDIRVEGLQRISEGTVYNYLPVNIGDRLDAQRIQEALRALYDTGFFRDVELRRDGNTLVVVVLERPVDRELRDQGQQGHQDRGPAEEPAQRRPRARARPSTARCSRTSSSTSPTSTSAAASTRVRIDTNVEEVPGNRVKVDHRHQRGQARQDPPDQHRRQRRSSRTRTSSTTSSSRRPTGCPGTSRTTATRASRCRATSRSCARSTWTAATRTSRSSPTQVTISPEKDDIFITVNVNEGEVYKVSEVKLAGTMVVPEAQLRASAAGAARRDVLHKLVTADAGADQLPPRRGRLRVRQGRSGADAGRRQERRCR